MEIFKRTLRFFSVLQNSSGTRVNRLKLKLIIVKLLKSFNAPPPFNDCNLLFCKLRCCFNKTRHNTKTPDGISFNLQSDISKSGSGVSFACNENFFFGFFFTYFNTY